MFSTPHLNPLEWLSAVILVIGGLNWGLVGIFDYNLVADIFGDGSFLTRAIYTIVGISALYTLFGLLRMEAMTTKDQQSRREMQRPSRV